MKEAIKYGMQSCSSEFDRRPSQSHSISYMAGERGSRGKPVYANGDRAKNPSGKANSVKQVKSKGLTGKGQGSGKSNFGPKGKVSSFKSSSSMKRTGK